MESCNNHRECIVVYSSRECPFCSMERDAQGEINRKIDKIDYLEVEVANLKEQLDTSE